MRELALRAPRRASVGREQANVGALARCRTTSVRHVACARARISAASSALTMAMPSAASAPQQRGLLVGDRLERAEARGVRERREQHHGDVGLRRSRRAARSRRARSCPSRAPPVSCWSSSAQQHHRHAELVVEVAAGREHARASARERRGGQLLGGGLAGRAGDGDDAAAPALPVRRGQIAERARGVGDLDARDAAAGTATCRVAAPARARAPARHALRQRSVRRRGVSPRSATNSVPGVDRARVDGHARAPRVGALAAHDRARRSPARSRRA